MERLGGLSMGVIANLFTYNIMLPKLFNDIIDPKLDLDFIEPPESGTSWKELSVEAKELQLRDVFMPEVWINQRVQCCTITITIAAVIKSRAPSWPNFT